MNLHPGTVRMALVMSLALLVPAARGADDDPAAATIALKKGDRIIFFGDSLTALAIKDRNVPEGKGYVPLVREALKDRGVEVDAVFLANKPTVGVIQIGVIFVNDTATTEKFKEQLEELIDKLQKGGARVV